MPNYVKNKLEIIGSPNKIEEVLDFLSGENTFIDFNNIVKMPESLSITSNSWFSPFENAFCKDEKMLDHLDKLKNYCKNNPERNDVDNFLKGIKNYIEHGYPTWYGWCVDNWGTKWNAMESEKIHKNVITFETAWNGVPDLISKVSDKFPLVRLVYKWSDECTGCNCGHVCFKYGESEVFVIENSSKEAYELAFELRPEVEVNYKFNGDTYEWTEEAES